jgi:hypothetical protein
LRAGNGEGTTVDLSVPEALLIYTKSLVLSLPYPSDLAYKALTTSNKKQRPASVQSRLPEPTEMVPVKLASMSVSGASSTLVQLSLSLSIDYSK